MKNNYELKETFLLRLENEELIKRLKDLKSQIVQLEKQWKELKTSSEQKK